MGGGWGARLRYRFRLSRFRSGPSVLLQVERYYAEAEYRFGAFAGSSSTYGDSSNLGFSIGISLGAVASGLGVY